MNFEPTKPGFEPSLQSLPLQRGPSPEETKLQVKVCAGTNCFLRDSRAILAELLDLVESQGLEAKVQVGASFCFERCGQGANVEVGGKLLHHCTGKKARAAVEARLNPGPQSF